MGASELLITMKSIIDVYIKSIAVIIRILIIKTPTIFQKFPRAISRASEIGFLSTSILNVNTEKMKKPKINRAGIIIIKLRGRKIPKINNTKNIFLLKADLNESKNLTSSYIHFL